MGHAISVGSAPGFDDFCFDGVAHDTASMDCACWIHDPFYGRRDEYDERTRPMTLAETGRLAVALTESDD